MIKEKRERKRRNNLYKKTTEILRRLNSLSFSFFLSFTPFKKHLARNEKFFPSSSSRARLVKITETKEPQPGWGEGNNSNLGDLFVSIICKEKRHVIYIYLLSFSRIVRFAAENRGSKSGQVHTYTHDLSLSFSQGIGYVSLRFSRDNPREIVATVEQITITECCASAIKRARLISTRNVETKRSLNTKPC